MRSTRSVSRSSSRNKSPSLANVNNNLNATMTASLKKSTKLPLIAGPTADDINGTGSNSNSPPTVGGSPATGASGLIVGTNSQQGKRPYQEDEFHIRQFLAPIGDAANEKVETHFFGLFDGHAGGRCSKYISTCLANTLAEDHQFVSNLPVALKRSFHTANDQFLKIAEKMKFHDGSTGLVAVVRDLKVLVANVGDCRCLIISGGKAIQMSIDQKPTDPAEQKRIASLGGSVVYCMGVARVNRVLAVSRAFGNRTLRTVIRPDAEMMQRDLTREDDYMVMASDGLWDVLKNKDVSDICYANYLKGDPNAIAEELVNTALARGSMDNVTCVCVKLSDYVARVMGSSPIPKAPSMTYPGLGGKLERTNSYSNTNSILNENFFTNPNAVNTNAATASNGAYTAPKQFSMGLLKPQDLGGGGGGGGGYDPNASTDNITIVAGMNGGGGGGGGGGSTAFSKRAATPQRMAPLHRTPSGNAEMFQSASTGMLASPKQPLKKVASTADHSMLLDEEKLEKFNFGPPPMYGSASPQTTRQYMTGSPVLYSTQPLADLTGVGGHSLKIMRGTQVSQSFGANEGSEKHSNGVSLIHDDISQFNKNRPSTGQLRPVNGLTPQQAMYASGAASNDGLGISFQDNVKQQQQQQQQLLAQQQQLQSGYALKKIPSNWELGSQGGIADMNGSFNKKTTV